MLQAQPTMQSTAAAQQEEKSYGAAHHQQLWCRAVQLSPQLCPEHLASYRQEGAGPPSVELRQRPAATAKVLPPRVALKVDAMRVAAGAVSRAGVCRTIAYMQSNMVPAVATVGESSGQLPSPPPQT